MATDDAANPYAIGLLELDLRHGGVSSIYGDDLAQAFALPVLVEGTQVRPIEGWVGACPLFNSGFEPNNVLPWSATQP